MSFPRYAFLLIATLLISPSAFSQSSLPASLQANRGTSDVDLLQLSGFDNEALLDRDEISREFSNGEKPLQIAEPYDISLTTADRGTWEEINGFQVWRLVIDSPNAYSLNVGFTSFELPEGASLWLYPDGEMPTFRAFTAADNTDSEELWSPIVLGERITVELNLPLGVTDYQLEIGQIAHAYRPFGIPGADLSVGRSGACNVDVVCPQGDEWWGVIPAIGVYTRSGIWMCSGSAINNTIQDGTPYFLTANHCGISSSNASSVVVYWNYQNSFCRPPGSSGGQGNGQLSQFNSGTILRGNGSSSDWALVEMANEINPEYEIVLAGWDRRDQITDSSVAIHHPSTNEKRISFDDDPSMITTYLNASPNPNGSHLRVGNWELGTTEGGSSGSPLFSPEQRIVGQLHGGYASCSSNTADWYGRVYTSMNAGLAQWLDPVGSGVEFIDAFGSDPLDFPPDLPAGPGDAMYFDGDTSFMSDVSNRLPEGEPVTFASWVMAEGPGKLASVNFDEESGFEVGIVEQDGDLFISYTHSGDSGSTIEHVFTDQALSGERHHIVVTRGGSPVNVRAFIDGYRVGTPYFYTEAPVTEGDRTLEIGTDFVGVLDEIRLHNAYHNQATLRSHMSISYGTGEGPGDLVAYFRFDSDTLGFIYDFSGNFVQGDITSGERVTSTFPVGELAVTLSSGTTASVGEEGFSLSAVTTESMGSGNLMTLYQRYPSSEVVSTGDLPENILWRSETVWGAFGVGEVTAALELDASDFDPVDGDPANSILFRASPDMPWIDVSDQWNRDIRVFTATGITAFGEWSVGFNPTVSGEAVSTLQGFELSAAYPNPFTTQAFITLTVPATSSVTVEVVDLLGRRVTLLHDGMTSAGPLTLELDGSGLAPGTYLIRAVGDHASVVRRVTLVR